MDDDALPPFRAVVIFDWYDGPLEGVARVETDRGAWWYFRALATRFNPDGVDHRLFALSAIPAEGASVLEGEFGDAERGPLVWPGEASARRRGARSGRGRHLGPGVPRARGREQRAV